MTFGTTHVYGTKYCSWRCIRTDSQGKVTILVDGIIGHCEGKNSYELVSNSERLPQMELFEFPVLTSFDFCLCGLDEERCLQNNGGYTRRIARSDLGSCRPHNGKWRSSQTSCKVHLGRRRDLRTFIANCNKSVISVWQVYRSNIKLKLR